MPAPDNVHELVKRFKDNFANYKSDAYNETQVRREFIDPFFSALGWDVDNKHGYAEAYKDVIHEDKVKVGGMMKAPDYSFRIGMTRKFFVEAKKPAVNLKIDSNPAKIVALAERMLTLASRPLNPPLALSFSDRSRRRTRRSTGSFMSCTD